MTDLSTYSGRGIIVINNDHPKGDLQVHQLAGWHSITVPNRGMNIGAWQQGFLARPNEDFYFFFQDECFIKQPGYIEACIQRFSDYPRLGMLGESLNLKWNHPWDNLRHSRMNWVDSEHQINGERVPRVEFYLATLERMGITPGESGLHLRSLCWSFRGTALRSIGGFPIGDNKGECIAAEIGVSRHIQQHGYQFDQISDTPFFYIGHREWRDDGSSKA